ncbi:MAG: DUF4340 domain-containing protein [Myxococcales bacterium]|nr:DUF4340 domain-containing protein [Myxococcales bacterium]
MTTEAINRALAITLGVQALFATIAWWPSASGPADAVDLIEVDAAELSQITIHSRILQGEVPDDPLVLKRDGDSWIIPSSFDYPASQANLDPLFEALDKLVVRRPIATQAYNHTAMDVHENERSRKLDLVMPDGDTISLYVGSAEGNAAHVRLADDDDVYRVRGVNPSSIPDRATRYFDRDFQKMNSKDVTSVTVQRPGQPPITFQRAEEIWTMPGRTPPGKILNQPGADAFVQSVVNLRMMEPHGTQVTPEMGFDTGVVVTWEASVDGAPTSGEYRVGSEIPNENGRVYLRTNQQPWVFEALSSQLQHALERGVDDLFDDA